MKTALIPNPYGAGTNGPITRIVYHCMGEFIRDDDGKVYYCTDWLMKLGLSAHALVTPSGVIIRTRRDDQGGYHAKGFNTGSLGIEFLVPGVHNYGTFLEAIKHPYITDIQMQAGIEQTREWLAKHRAIANVDAHSELTSKKPDPGEGFDKQIYMDGIGWS